MFLVFLAQQRSSPLISNNNIESCLIGFICGSASCPKISDNIFHCILMSIGLFIEDSRGLVNQNQFRKVELLL
jgi:hypothetical protein